MAKHAALRSARSHRTSSRVKKAHKSRMEQWRLHHLAVAAMILVALVISIPVGAYLKASVFGAQVAGLNTTYASEIQAGY
jgi:hypothetical protein